MLEIAVPPSEFDDLWRGIIKQWPSYLGYVTSFLTIGGLWLFHQGIFRRMKYADNMVIRLNLAPLMTVSFLPFPTKLMAEALHEKSGEQAAVLFYGATLLVTTTILAWMERYAARVTSSWRSSRRRWLSSASSPSRYVPCSGPAPAR